MSKTELDLPGVATVAWLQQLISSSSGVNDSLDVFSEDDCAPLWSSDGAGVAVAVAVADQMRFVLIGLRVMGICCFLLYSLLLDSWRWEADGG